MLYDDFRQNPVPKHMLKVFFWSLVLAIKLVLLDISLGSKAREVTANLLACEKIAIPE